LNKDIRTALHLVTSPDSLAQKPGHEDVKGEDSSRSTANSVEERVSYLLSHLQEHCSITSETIEEIARSYQQLLDNSKADKEEIAKLKKIIAEQQNSHDSTENLEEKLDQLGDNATLILLHVDHFSRVKGRLGTKI